MAKLCRTICYPLTDVRHSSADHHAESFFTGRGVWYKSPEGWGPSLSGMWEKLQLPESDEPIYRRLADAIAQRIASGELAAGDRLPPQRDIARAVGLNVTTVTRAFSSLQQRGLVEARRGRGTLVAQRDSSDEGSFRSAPSDEVGLIDLSVNRPATAAYLDGLGPLLTRLTRDRRYAALQDYHPPEGPAWARQAAAQWLAPFAGSADAGRVVLTDGAQHGLACVFTAIAGEG